MNDDQKNEEKPRLTPEELRELEVEALIGEAAGKGWRLVIHRTDPKWCAGYCDTWPLDGPIELADIRDAWGGRRFRLKIHGEKARYIRDLVIDIDDVPRRRGIPIRPAGFEFEKEIPTPTPAPAPSAPPFDVAGFLERANDRQLAMMDRILEARAATPAATPAASNPVDQIQALAEAVTKIREVSSMFNVDQDNTNTMLEGFLKLLEAKERSSAAQDRRRQLPPAQPQRRQIGPPGPPGPPGAPGPRQQQQPGPPTPEYHQAPQGREPGPALAPVPEEPEPEPEELDPVELLGQFEPADAGAAIREYFETLSPLDAQKALSAVLGQEVSLDDLSTLRAQSGHGAPDPIADDHGPQDPHE